MTGEATPGYLYCITCPTYILKYIPRIRLLFTLRNPVVRSYSEYLNKREDKTVHTIRPAASLLPPYPPLPTPAHPCPPLPTPAHFFSPLLTPAQVSAGLRH